MASQDDDKWKIFTDSLRKVSLSFFLLLTGLKVSFFLVGVEVRF